MKKSTVRMVTICGLFLGAGAYGGYEISRAGIGGTTDSSKLSITRRAVDVQAQKEKSASSEKGGQKFSEKDMRKLMERLQEGMTNEEFRLEYEKLYELGPESSLAIRILMMKWATTDPHGGMAELGKKNRVVDFPRDRLLWLWSESDPAAAARFYMENKDQFFDHHSLQIRIMENWVKESPDQAWNLLKENNPEGNAYQMAAFFQELIKTHPEQMGKFANGLNTSALHGYWLVKDIVDSWSKIDYASASQWLEKQPEIVRRNLESVLAGALVLQDRQQAIEMYETWDKDQKTDAFHEMGKSMLSEYSYQETAEFLLSLSRGNATPAEMRPVYQKWLNHYPEGFKGWITQMIAGKSKDRALGAYSTKRFFLDYEEAVSMMNSIGNEEIRDMSIENVLDTWKRENPQKMNSWVEKSDWPQEKKERWLGAEN